MIKLVRLALKYSAIPLGQELARLAEEKLKQVPKLSLSLDQGKQEKINTVILDFFKAGPTKKSPFLKKLDHKFLSKISSFIGTSPDFLFVKPPRFNPIIYEFLYIKAKGKKIFYSAVDGINIVLGKVLINGETINTAFVFQDNKITHVFYKGNVKEQEQGPTLQESISEDQPYAATTADNINIEISNYSGPARTDLQKQLLSKPSAKLAKAFSTKGTIDNISVKLLNNGALKIDCKSKDTEISREIFEADGKRIAKLGIFVSKSKNSMEDWVGQVDFFKSLGVTELQLNSAWVGSYLWPSLGFEFASDQDKKFALQQIRTRINNVSHVLPISEAQKINTALKSEDPQLIAKLEIETENPKPILDEIIDFIDPGGFVESVRMSTDLNTYYKNGKFAIGKILMYNIQANYKLDLTKHPEKLEAIREKYANKK